MEDDGTPARRLWQVIEPLHATVYFSPIAADAMKGLGLRGWWMGYFAGRFAPLGPIGPEPVTAMAFGFAPGMVARALPDAWTYAAPEAVVEARVASAAAALRASLPEDAAPAVAELADLLEDPVAGCSFEGRPLGAAWSAVVPPDDAFARLWLATSVLREHRGDGHVAAWVAHGVAGLEATVLQVAHGAMPRGRIQPNRGWTDDEWAAAVDRLTGAGLLSADGTLTAAGEALREEVEDMTDRIAAGASERVVELALPLSRHVVDSEAVPVPNPIGVPRP